MKPVVFPEANTFLKVPNDEIEEKMPAIPDLPVHRNAEMVVSCWEPTTREILEIVRTKKVWLLVMGSTHAPVALTGIKPEFGK